MDPSGWEDCACFKVDTAGGQHSMVVRRPRDYALLVLGLNAALQVAAEAVNVRRPVGELRWSHLVTVLQ